MRFPSYLVKNRYGIYYVQIVFPKHIRHILNKKEVRRSLKTTDRKMAVIMAQEFKRIAEKLFPVIAEGRMNWIETKTMLDNIADRLFQLYVQKVNEVGFDFDDPYSLDAIMPEAATFLGTPPSDTCSRYHFESDKKMTLKELIKEYLNVKINIERKWKNPRTIKGYEENLNRIAEIFAVVTEDENYPINLMTKAHARKVREILAILPANLKKKYPKLSMNELISQIQKKELILTDAERLKPATFNTYANFITGLFNYAEAEDFIVDNYFKNIRVSKQTSKKRDPFTNQELERFFNTSLFVKKDFTIEFAWRFWVPVIMLYTGCRLEEVCQLFIDDVYKIDNILCFHIRKKTDKTTGKNITSIKNRQSERFIPVHSKLKDIGLIKYIDFLKKEEELQLFPNLKNKTKTGRHKQYHTSVSKFFNENNEKHYTKSYITECGIKDSNKVLYCFRHTVESCLVNHSSEIQHDNIDTLLGHKITSTGRRHYAKLSMQTLLNIVEKIDYPGANLPWDVHNDYNSVAFSWEK